MVINPANVISVLRAVLAFVAAFLLLEVGGTIGHTSALITIVIAVILDVIDGRVARAWGYSGEIGKLSDIYADHILANAVWVSLAFLGLVSVWVPLITTSRDLVVDWFRQAATIPTGLNAFQQVEGSKASWIVCSRSMRFIYATGKLAVWVMAILGLYFPLSHAITITLGLTIGLCLLRAVPAIAAGWRHVFFAESTL